MIKEITKEKIVKVQVRQRICDLCEEVISENANFFRVVACLNKGDGRMYTGGSDGNFDVCSAGCLSEKGKALGLVAHTKIFPKLHAASDASDAKTKYPAGEFGSTYASKGDPDLLSF